MRFPGPRIAKHYFPVRGTAAVVEAPPQPAWYLAGIDQTIVDMEVRAPASFAADLGLVEGESVVLDSDRFAALISRIEQHDIPRRMSPGGSVANTLNNYAHLSGEGAVLLGAIPNVMRFGEPAFHYVAQNPKGVSLDHVVPREGAMGTAITFVSPDGDRSFAVAPGISNDYGAEDLPPQIVSGAAACLASLYTLSAADAPITAATMRCMDLAQSAGVPVAFGLGTAGLVRKLKAEVRGVLEKYVTIAAMNAQEAATLTDQSDVLLACEKILDWVDLVIITEGARGLTIGGYVDEGRKRHTRQALDSAAIPEYNRYEFSRLMCRADCPRPLKIYTHIYPYRGGPDRMINTSGAGDAALAAVLHDVTANRYHRDTVPESPKHPEGTRFLSYSSLSRIAQYSNRVAYEVLRGASPRLDGPVGRDRQSDRISR